MPIRQGTPPNFGDRGLVTTLPRWAVNNENSMTSGTMRLSYFTAPRTDTFSKVRVYSGATAAAATPTLCRVGLYTVASDGALTLVASTVNSTSVFAAANTAYERSLSASYALTAGVRYAVGVLVVTAATAPTIKGCITWNAAESGLADRICGLVFSQTDLPASVTSGSVGDSTVMAYAALVA